MFLLSRKMNQRLHLIISGKVQGVSFRYYIKKMAELLKLTGWVENVQDNTVEAIFEGEEKRLKQMLEFCKKGPTEAIIENIQENWGEFSGEFNYFEIKF